MCSSPKMFIAVDNNGNYIYQAPLTYFQALLNGVETNNQN